MTGLSSPPRFLPPISPYRAPSPTMSPGGRRGRSLASSEEGRLRHLSPSTTLRAFTQKPMPYDTTRDEYKMFACIDSLTPAERDLGARVAKAAQRLKSWCDEIEKWGWSGTFEPPSVAFREQRRRSLELRIREHVKDVQALENMPELEYWGSLLSVEVEQHEARLDEMGEELLTLDIEELKGHVLDMHGGRKSRPSSAGYGAGRPNYTPMDDFDFLITQTLLSALPHHFQLNDRLSTWTARVSVLREAPRYLDDLQTAQKAMRLGWDAIEPPADDSNAAFDKWKEATETIAGVLHGKVSDLGRRLDIMLDTLEGREDVLPEAWIDTFEGVEADFGRWDNESRKRLIEFDVRRKDDQTGVPAQQETSAKELVPHSIHRVTSPDAQLIGTSEPSERPEPAKPIDAEDRPPTAVDANISEPPRQQYEDAGGPLAQHINTEPDTSTNDDSSFDEGDTIVHNELEEDDSSEPDLVVVRPRSTSFSDSPVIITTDEPADVVVHPPQTPTSRRGSVGSISSDISFSSSPPSVVEDSPSVRNATARTARAPRPALNAAMGKRRPGKSLGELSADNTPPWPPSQFIKQPRNSAEDLERKISDILTTIPAHIRLTSSDAREVKAARGVTNQGSKGYLRATRSINGMKSPELTLSPVKQDSDSANSAAGRKSATAIRGDNDIKLYHLTQPGKDIPIKLFIRRVGENGERVMVRVGGGWADLGEYLRQYAEHHGRRTVSDGKFEIVGLEVKHPDMPPTRPESALSRRDRRFSGGSQIGSPLTTPVKLPETSLLKDEVPPPMPTLSSTPVVTGDTTSTPSTGSSRHSWQGNEVGLAGPKARKLDLSGDKLEWIEGMMKQAKSARSVSSTSLTTNNSSLRPEHPPQPRDTSSRAESRSESRSGARKKDFGDLGKVGGTKRIFLRGGATAEREHQT
ncbi:hypothetical protein BDV95DRAFT_593436 [Massariosphaeria phaeospora]|uniref:GAR domain-containing protein n=1 Tax=Massariosphaeria phaeospora TaxID=100035 RepID=A0A7C8MC98_9PLEO|nr:hypothetical protein BDV95DRAFT_593436 [Massariosphaeria phaeospora]